MRKYFGCPAAGTVENHAADESTDVSADNSTNVAADCCAAGAESNADRTNNNVTVQLYSDAATGCIGIASFPVVLADSDHCANRRRPRQHRHRTDRTAQRRTDAAGQLSDADAASDPSLARFCCDKVHFPRLPVVRGKRLVKPA